MCVWELLLYYRQLYIERDREAREARSQESARERRKQKNRGDYNLVRLAPIRSRIIPKKIRLFKFGAISFLPRRGRSERGAGLSAGPPRESSDLIVPYNTANASSQPHHQLHMRSAKTACAAQKSNEARRKKQDCVWLLYTLLSASDAWRIRKITPATAKGIAERNRSLLTQKLAIYRATWI